MLVDGRAIAADIYKEIKNTISHANGTPHVTVFTCVPNLETQKFLALKKKKAAEVGIGVNVIEFTSEVTTAEVIKSVLHAAMQTDGIILQLPFPAQVDVAQVFQELPKELDIDCMNYDESITSEEVLPPVVGAIKEIAKRHNVIFAATKVVVVGEGRLVGKPAAVWARKQGAEVAVIHRNTESPAEILKTADIIISGAGDPGIIKPDMIKDNVIIFDAGTSEDGGVLKGDADPACADKAALFTPVPGGIGPITVAVLLRNLVNMWQG